MEITKETELENGDYLWELNYSPMEYEIFKEYTKKTLGDEWAEDMKENDVVQFAIKGILKEQIGKDRLDESE